MLEKPVRNRDNLQDFVKKSIYSLANEWQVLALARVSLSAAARFPIQLQ